MRKTFIWLLIVFSCPVPAFAETRERQVNIESKFVEVNNAQTRELGVDLNHNREIAHTRSLEHLGQTGNLPQTKNIFDFKPLDFNPPQPTAKKIVSPAQIQVPAAGAAKIVKPVELQVIPQVQNDGSINMAVTPVQTNFEVPNGDTTVTGGLQEEKSANNVPVLSKIPLIGRLFRNKNSEKKDLVIVLTPQIIKSEH